MPAKYISVDHVEAIFMAALEEYERESARYHKSGESELWMLSDACEGAVIELMERFQVCPEVTSR